MLANCEGKDVRGSDGHAVGRVVRCDASELVVESGLFTVHAITLSTDEVSSITDHELYLRRPAHHYRRGTPKSAWTPWHSGRRDAEGREDIEALAKADREHRLGAQGLEGLKSKARTSLPAHADRLEAERDDRLACPEDHERPDPNAPKEVRGSPPEACMGLEHPEDEPWP